MISLLPFSISSRRHTRLDVHRKPGTVGVSIRRCKVILSQRRKKRREAKH